MTKEFLLQEYIENHKSIHRIAIENGCSDEIIRRRLKNFDIPRRKTGVPATGLYTNRDWLKNEYRTLQKTMKQIANELGVGETVIKKWIDRYNIKPFSHSERLTGVPKSLEHIENLKKSASLRDTTGVNNPNYKGGNYRWDKKIRRSKEFVKWKDTVLIRDKYTCRICGSDDVVHAHHIIPFAKYPEYRFNVNNGITLCNECHKKAHNEKVSFN